MLTRDLVPGIYEPWDSILDKPLSGPALENIGNLEIHSITFNRPTMEWIIDHTYQNLRNTHQYQDVEWAWKIAECVIDEIPA